MTWRPTASMDTLRQRAQMLEETRAFFKQCRVLEVQTPVLDRYTVTDIHLDSFSVGFKDKPWGYLQTSPEYAMKRLLAAGSGSIYQIMTSFRANEQGHWHHPEFTMLEWYQLNYSMQDLIDEVCQYLHLFLHPQKLRQVTYQNSFIEALQIDPLDISYNEVCQIIQNQLPHAFVPTDLDTALDLLLSELIIPQWPNNQLTILTHYPSSQAALARLDAKNPSVALRFEIFLGRLELANGFEELTCHQEQQERFSHDQSSRQQANQDDVHQDPYFLAALESGLPVCSGVALGFDRLVMAVCKKSTLRQVVSFSPFLDR
jgi:elongation factor P--(R)-beta-lysine ligase